MTTRRPMQRFARGAPAVAACQLACQLACQRVCQRVCQPVRRRIFGAVRTVLAMAVVACGSDESKPVPAVRTTGGGALPTTQLAATTSLQVTRAAASDTILITGTASDVAERSTFTAYAIDGHIARIDELSATGNDAKFVRAFVFDPRERLAHMTEDKSQLVSNTNASPSQQHVTVVVDMDSTVVTKSAKRVDGVEKPMQSWDVDNVRRHAELLVALARPGIAMPMAPRP